MAQSMLAFLLAGMLAGACGDSYVYPMACSPSPYLSSGSSSTCNIVLFSTTNDAEVIVHTSGGDTELTIFEGEPYVYALSPDFIADTGVEDKGIEIESNEPIQIVVLLDDTNERVRLETYKPYEKHFTGIDYFGLSFAGSSCSTTLVNYFYILISHEDDTTISIIDSGVTEDTVNLNRFSTYTWKTTTSSSDSDEVTGKRFLGNKNFTVMSGNLCLHHSSCYSSTISALRPVHGYGQTYYAPTVGNATEGGYELNIVAAEDGTTLTIDGGTYTLNSGQNYSFSYQDVDDIVPFECSGPCYGVLASYGVSAVKAVFMLDLVPTEDFTTRVEFATMNYTGGISELSLVVLGDPPVVDDDIYLDGNPLSSYNWRTRDGASFLHLEVPQGLHEVVSVNKIFAAYFYSSNLNSCAGYGYTINEGIREDVSPPDYVLPRLLIRTNGTAATDGTNLTPLCAAEYSSLMLEQAKKMGIKVDEIIGDEICSNVVPADMFVSNVYTLANINGDDGMLFEIDDILRFQAHKTVKNVVACAMEIANYVTNHDNWERPILPQITGCPVMEFDPERFDWMFNKWDCSQTFRADDVDNTLVYDVIVADLLDTVDGSNLDADCSRDYGDAASSKTASIVPDFIDAIKALCGDDTATYVTHTYVFTALGNQAYFQPTFVLIPSDDIRFDTFLDCTFRLSGWLSDQRNWGAAAGPIIPTPSGCPALESDSGFFVDNNSKWGCVGIVPPPDV